MRNKGKNKGTRRKELPEKKGGIIGTKCPQVAVALVASEVCSCMKHRLQEHWVLTDVDLPCGRGPTADSLDDVQCHTILC